MQSVLVTGVAGMLGSHLADALLARGTRVVGVDDLSYGRLANLEGHLADAAFRFLQLSVLDAESLTRLAHGVDAIVHLAAVKKVGEAQSSLATLRVNATGTENVLEAARASGAKLVFASTSDVYGMSPDLPFREDGDLLLGPGMVRRWSYAVSKLYGEQLCFAYHKDYGLPVVVLRYFGGFSPRSSFAWSGGHIPIFIRAVLRDEEVPIHGDGSQTRSMAYVDDLIEGTLLALDNPMAVGEIINLGNAEELSVLEAARLIHRLAATGRGLKLRFVPLEEVFGAYRDIQRRVPDLSKARRLLGYAPRYSMEEAIRLTIDAVRASGADAGSAPP
jgi:UDP-glucose 4-epimerase